MILPKVVAIKDRLVRYVATKETHVGVSRDRVSKTAAAGAILYDAF